MANAQRQLGILYQKAVAYAEPDSSMNEATFLYRNQSASDWNNIQASGGIIRPKVKDRNGDPNNPINGKLSGIFFGASVKNFTKAPPQSSPFGPIRFQVPLKTMLDNIKPYLLYFTDFYCTYVGGPHYVTIVMCKNGTTAQNFCCQNLLPLPPINPFFVILFSESSFKVSGNVWVEIFYTEEIDVNQFCLPVYGASVYETEVYGSPARNLVSKPKNCTYCNV